MALSLEEIFKIDYFKGWYPQWIHNGYRNFPIIRGDFKKGNASVSRMPDGKGKPAIIVGSGPSLDDAIPYLKDWEHPIFCGPTNALALEANGIHPTYLHAYDSHRSNADRLKYKWDYSKTELVTHPSTHTSILQAWKGRRWYFLRSFKDHEYFEMVLPIAWSHICDERGIDVIFPFRGCVVNNEVAIACYLHYSPLFMVGVDFGWRDPAKTRHVTYVQDGKGLIPAPMTHEDELSKSVEINVSPGGVHFVGKDDNFKRHFLDTIGPLSTDIFDCSDGMVSELIKADIKEVVKKQGEGYRYSPQEKGEMRKRIIAFLRSKT